MRVDRVSERVTTAPAWAVQRIAKDPYQSALTSGAASNRVTMAFHTRDLAVNPLTWNKRRWGGAAPIALVQAASLTGVHRHRPGAPVPESAQWSWPDGLSGWTPNAGLARRR